MVSGGRELPDYVSQKNGQVERNINMLDLAELSSSSIQKIKKKKTRSLSNSTYTKVINRTKWRRARTLQLFYVYLTYQNLNQRYY